MPTDLTQASNEWASRPADERFKDIGDMWLHTKQAHDRAAVDNVALHRVTAVEADGQVRFTTPGHDAPLKTTNWSFGQLSTRLGATSEFLGKLRRSTLLTVANERLATLKGSKGEASLYYDRSSNELRSITSQDYGRIPNHEVCRAIMELPGNWTNPPARPISEDQAGVRIATQDDVDRCGRVHSSLGIKVGDRIADAGLYASDRNMFAFMVDPTRRVDDGSDGGLYRGFFARNSEVGDAYFDLTVFLYRELCGNHIVWSCSQIKHVRVKHIGRGASLRAFDGMQDEIQKYVDSSTEKEEQTIRAAKTREIADTQKGVLEKFYDELGLMTKREAEGAYALAEQHEATDGNPRTFWGFTQGLTRLSQRQRNADRRIKLDALSSKIMSMVN